MVTSIINTRYRQAGWLAGWVDGRSHFVCFSSRSNRLLSSGLSSHSSVSVPLSSVSKWSMFSRNLHTDTVIPPSPLSTRPYRLCWIRLFLLTRNKVTATTASSTTSTPAPDTPSTMVVVCQDELLLPRPTAKRT